MPQDVDEARTIFEAESRSLLETLQVNGRHFYIPAYQRHYNWSRNDVERLIETIVSGLTNPTHNDENYAFVGAIILTTDSNHETISPLHLAYLPAKVDLVIDGQQRLTTLILFLLCLHEQLRVNYERLNLVNQADRSQLQNEIMEYIPGRLLIPIQKSLFENTYVNADKNVPYLRLIRAYDDAWSKVDHQRIYNSPIARIVNEYAFNNSGFDLKSPATKFTFGKSSNQHINLCGKRFQDLRKILQKIFTAKGIGEAEVSVPGVDALTKSGILERALSLTFTKPALACLDSADSADSDAIRLMALTQFVLHRVVLTTVRVKNEDYALSVFDVLNSTGQPLQPFETFKPLVMKSVGLSKYLSSPEKSIMDEIENSFGTFDNTKDTALATDSVISLALAENGYKIGRRIETQRTYLRNAYKMLEHSATQQIEFLDLFRTTAYFHKETFKTSDWKMPKLPNDEHLQCDEEVKVCISFLCQLKHTIAIPVLVRFCNYLAESAGTDREDASRKHYHDAIKACTAFTVLLRATTGATEGIDDIYRELMSGENCKTEVGGFQRNTKDHNGGPRPLAAVDSSLLIAELATRLTDSKGISNRAEFIQRAATVHIYRHSSVLTRFMLLAAQKDAIADAASQGLLAHGLPDVFPSLTMSQWAADNTNSIEHVAPQTQNKNTNWDELIYSDLNAIHRIGNLVLCPQKINSYLGNKSWNHKKSIYAAVSSRDKGTAKGVLDAARIPVDEKFFDHLKYIPYLEAVGHMSSDWDANFIQTRSENILGLIWDNLIPWLKIN